MRYALLGLLQVALLASADAQTEPSLHEPAAQSRRIALVISNSSYAHLPHIPGAVAEAKLITSALGAAGFEIISIENASLQAFVDLQKSFFSKLQAKDACLFYFTGYAIQAGDDDFLLPVDFKPEVSGSLRSRAYPVLLFAKTSQLKQASPKLIFVEASRRINATLADASPPGLLIPDITDVNEVLIALSAGANQFVDTRPDEIGYFTRSLSEYISTKGSSVLELMPKVLKAVRASSGDQQQPAYSANITANLLFRAPDPAIGVAHQNRRDREPYVWIPPGKFLMGCAPGDDKCQKDEKPQHEVTISKGFWMGQTEVRVSSYQHFVADGPKKSRKMPDAPDWNKKWKLDNRPIANMRWEDARDYCAWAAGRLPTEAEWEYAARAGKSNEIYPLNSENSRDKANFHGKQGNDNFDDPAPVGSFDANAFQLFDMAGNVWELVNDLYSETSYAQSPAVDPQGASGGKERVVRGGSYDSDPKEHLRISIRRHFRGTANATGFRCVLDDSAATRRTLQLQ